MNIFETIAKRHSCRSFKDEQITDKELETILQAANAAPVGMGNYSDVKLTVVQNRNLISKIENVTYQATNSVGEHAAYEAPTLIIVSAKKDETVSVGLPHRNASCIMQNMMLASTALGLGSVYIMSIPMVIESNSELCKELMIPDGFFPVSIMAVGKPKDEVKAREMTLSKIGTDFLK